MAGAHNVSRLGRLRGPSLAVQAALGRQLAALGYVTTDDSGNPISVSDSGSITPIGPGGGGISPSIAQLISTGITTAGGVASVALRPPTYSSVSTPYGTSISSYAPIGASAFGASSLASIGSLLGSPVVLLGLGVLLFVVLKQR